MQIKIFYFVFCIFAVLIISCQKKVGKQVETKPVTLNSCDTITYERHIKPIIVAKCNSCHAPGSLSSGYDISTYSLLKLKVTNGSLKKRVIDDVPPNSMPQGSNKLPSAQLSLIQCWITNGTKEK